MRIAAKFRTLVALLIFLLIAGCLGIPHLYILLARKRVFGGDPAKYRRLINKGFSFWADMTLSILKPVLGLKILIRMPENLWLLKEGDPLIVIANHQNSFESLVYEHILRGLNKDNIRYVAKNELLKAPLVGLGLQAGGSAFIARNKSKSDLRSVADSAKMARADGGTFFIYPEGTRGSNDANGANGLRRLGRANRGGFVTCCKEMNAPVLTMAGDFIGSEGTCKTMFEVDALVGSLIVVNVALYPPVPHDFAEEWLDREWQRMDDVLTGHTTEPIPAHM